MSLLLEVSHSNITADKVRYAYTANLAAALILLRVKNRKASTLLHDDKFNNLRKYGSHSPLNHWGFFLFNSLYNDEGKKYLNGNAIKSLHKMAGRFIEKRIKAIHKHLSAKNNLTQDWELQSENLKLVILRLESSESDIKHLANSLQHWNSLDIEEQIENYNIAFYYLQRHDPQSKLLELLRNQINMAMTHVNQQNEKENMTENLFKKINSLLEDDGATAGATTTGDGSSNGATSSKSIAPIEQRLFRNKVIIRRKRDYVKPKKFKMETLQQLIDLSSVVIEWNDLDYTSENYTGFEEVKKQYHINSTILEHSDKFPKVRLTGTKENIYAFLKEQYGHIPSEFLLELGSSIRNDSAPSSTTLPTVNTTKSNVIKVAGDKNDAEASNEIDQKHDDAAASVDTHAYGLETSDGKIVKIYVSVNDSEQFEKELADNLTHDQEIEDVVNNLADKFDIVSVDWPEGMTSKDEASTIVKDTATDEGEAEEGEEAKYKLDFNISHAHKKEEESDEKEKSEEEKPEEGGQESDKDKEEPSEDELDKEPEESDDLSLEPAEETDEEDNLNLDDEETDKDKKEEKPKKKKNKSKDKTMKESLLSELLNDFIVEKKDEEENFKEGELKIEDIFKSPMQRKLIKLLFLLDFPVDRLLLKKNQLRKSIRETANKINSIGQAKILINKLIVDLSALEHADKKYQKELQFVNSHDKKDLNEGVEEELTNEMQILLLKLYVALGVPESVINYKKTLLKNEVRKTAKLLNQHMRIKNNLHRLARLLHLIHGKDEEENLNEELKLSGDAYVNLIINLAVQLGFPEPIIERNRMLLVNAIKDKKPDNFLEVRNKIIALYKVLQPAVSTNEDMDYHMAHSAQDLGDWSIQQVGNKLKLHIKDITITIDDVDLFLHSIDNGVSTYIKDGKNKWYFKSVDHGNQYVISKDEDDVYDSGILMKQKTIDKLLSLDE